MINQEAWQLADQVKTQYYKMNVKADDIVKSLQSDQALVKAIGADKIKEFVYKTLYIPIVEGPKKEVKK